MEFKFFLISLFLVFFKLSEGTTDNLEPCKIYSLPPYYRENCTKSGGVYTSTYSMGLCNDKECKCSYFTCATPTPTQEPTPTTNNLEPCKIYSLPPYYRENCTKSGGVYTSTYSIGLCNDKECECPYFTCATPTPTQKPIISTKIVPTITKNNLEPCKTYSLPPYYRENCTKSGGVYTSTYSMGLCNDKECECPYFTCAMENTKATKTITVTKSVPTVTITKATTKTLKAYESEPTNGATTQCAKKWNQCGGIGFNGPTCCESGSTCHELNKYYSQCM